MKREPYVVAVQQGDFAQLVEGEGFEVSGHLLDIVSDDQPPQLGDVVDLQTSDPKAVQGCARVIGRLVEYVPESELWRAELVYRE